MIDAPLLPPPLPSPPASNRPRPLSSRPFSTRLISVLAAVALVALAAGCSDDADDSSRPDDGTPDVADVGFDIEEPGDADVLPTIPDAGGDEDVRRPPPRDTGGWDWDTSDPTPAPFGIESVVPPQGPVEGGTRVQIRGSSLDPAVRVFFGSREVAVQMSGNHLVGTAPPASGPGPITVKAVHSDGTISHLDDGFTYVATLAVHEVTPARIPTDGGVEVHVHGQGFESPMGVSFSGERAWRVEVVDATLLRAVAPAHPRGPADLLLTTPSQQLEVPGAVEYFAPLRVHGVSPTSGPTAGGQTVTIEAEGLTSTTRVMFGEREAEVQAVDAAGGTITVTTPAGPAGLSSVSLHNGNDSARLDDAYLYQTTAAPTLAAAHPAFGPTSGGTLVRLVGHGFDAAGTRILFGADAAEIVEASSGHAIVRTPAASAPGAVDIVFSIADTERARLPAGFDYRRALEIVSATPAEGPIDGGTIVTLRGSGFDAGVSRVRFGGLDAAFEVVSATEIRATSPAHGAALVDVVIERDGLEARLSDGYRFVEPLEIWSYSPVRGSIAGGTHVTVHGRGFNGLLEVELGGKPATGVRRVDDHTFTFRTPANDTGEATLRLTAAGRSVTGPYPYLYFNPTHSFGGASGDAVDGAVNVTVLAQGGSPVANAFVMLSTRADSPYTGITDENGQLTLSGPDVLGAQTITATAARHSSTTIQTVDAENVTLFLTPLDGQSGGGGGGNPIPYGWFHGTVSSKGKTSNPDGDVAYDMAIVRTTNRHTSGGTIAPGGGSVVMGAGEYEIRSRIGDVALIALCGTYHEPTDTFTPQFMAIERYLFVADQGRYNVDLECDIPLDRTARIKLVNPVFAPGGPNTNIVNVYWDFGFEGVFPSPIRGQSLESLITVPRQPAAEGPLSDMTYSVVGGSYTDGYVPLTQTSRANITTLDHTIDLPPLLDVPELTSPASGGVMVGNRIRFRAGGPYPADFYVAVIRNLQGLPIWQVVLPGSETVITMPEFPSFATLPTSQRPMPYPPGPLYLNIYGIRAPEFRYERFTYQDLSSERWQAYSIGSWVIQLTP